MLRSPLHLETIPAGGERQARGALADKVIMPGRIIRGLHRLAGGILEVDAARSRFAVLDDGEIQRDGRILRRGQEKNADQRLQHTYFNASRIVPAAFSNSAGVG